jgi:hypothetical protein
MLFGRELFSHNIRVDHSTPAHRLLSSSGGGGSAPIFHFDDMGNALMVVFNIYYKEEWHHSMYEFATVMPVSSFIYFLVCIVLLHVFFMRLVQAVFINEFGKQFKALEAKIEPINYTAAFSGLKTRLKMVFKLRQARIRIHPRNPELDVSKTEPPSIIKPVSN